MSNCQSARNKNMEQTNLITRTLRLTVTKAEGHTCSRILQDEKSKMTEKVDLLLAQLKGKESELAVVTAEAKEDRKKMDDRQIRISYVHTHAVISVIFILAAPGSLKTNIILHIQERMYLSSTLEIKEFIALACALLGDLGIDKGFVTF